MSFDLLPKGRVGGASLGLLHVGPILDHLVLADGINGSLGEWLGSAVTRVARRRVILRPKAVQSEVACPVGLGGSTTGVCLALAESRGPRVSEYKIKRNRRQALWWLWDPTSPSWMVFAHDEILAGHLARREKAKSHLARHEKAKSHEKARD